MSEDYKVQVSISLPPVGQYAKGDMVNFRGESAEEVEALLDAALEGGFFEKAALASAKYLVATGLQDRAAGPSEPPSAAPGDGATVTQLRTCKHGKRTRREGDSSKGHWVGYFCPLQKGDPDQCKAEFE